MIPYRFFRHSALLAILTACSGSVSGEGDAGPPSDATTDTMADADAGAESAADGNACAQGSITFQMQATAGSSQRYCLGAPNSCSSEWLSVLGPDGGAIQISAPCQAQCGTCMGVACPLICAIPSPMPDGGARQTWYGNAFNAGTCGPSHLTCVDPVCLSAGNYVARMCAYPDSSQDGGVFTCSPAATPTCTDVTFAWPPPGGSGVAQGTIPGDAAPPADGGACCPSGWSMYSCTFSGGGQGLACHNPALGCASSLTCGLGCDTVVTGRCDDGG
jgi:hypothetical protein